MLIGEQEDDSAQEVWMIEVPAVVIRSLGIGQVYNFVRHTDRKTLSVRILGFDGQYLARVAIERAFG